MSDTVPPGAGLDVYPVLSPFGWFEASTDDLYASAVGACDLLKLLLSCAMSIAFTTVCLWCMRAPVLGECKVDVAVVVPV